MVRLLLVLLNHEPVVLDGLAVGGSGGVLALDLDSHALVLLQAGGEVGLLGRLGGGGDGEGLDLALGVGLLNGGGLVGLELLEVELLDEVGCIGDCRLVKWVRSKSFWGDDDGDGMGGGKKEERRADRRHGRALIGVGWSMRM